MWMGEMGVPWLTLLVVVGCRPEVLPDTSVPILEEITRVVTPDGRVNMLMPHEVEMDLEGRRAYVSSYSTHTVGVIDLDTHEVVTILDLNEWDGLSNMVVDGQGTVWVPAPGYTFLRVEPDSGEVTSIPTTLPMTNMLGRAEGGLFVAAATGEGVPYLAVLDTTGAEVQGLELEGPPQGLDFVDGGEHLVYTFQTPGDRLFLVIREASDLSPVGAWPVTMFGEHVAQYADGTLLLIRTADVVTLDLATGTIQELHVGDTNKEAIPTGPDMLVLDCVGIDVHPTTSVGRLLDTRLQSLAPPMELGKNACRGAKDPVTGLLWINSEGTDEVLVVDATAGVQDSVRLGVHIEDLVGDPEHPGRVYFTGRLSQTIGRVDMLTGDVLFSPLQTGWARQPTVVDDALWVVDQFSSTLYSLDLETLEPVGSIETGWAENETLCLDTLSYNAERGTLFLAQGEANVLLEIDPDARAVVREWALPGEAWTAEDAPGQLEHVSVGDAIITLRTADGVLARVDLASEMVSSSTTLETATLESVVYGAAPNLLYATPDSGWVYVGGLAFDPSTLTAVPAEDLVVTRVLGKLDDGTWLGWRLETSELVHLKKNGTLIAKSEMAYCDWEELSAIHVPTWEDRVLYVVQNQGEIRAAPVPR